MPAAAKATDGIFSLLWLTVYIMNAFHASRTCRNSAKNRFATQLTLVQSNKSIGLSGHCQVGDLIRRNGPMAKASRT